MKKERTAKTLLWLDDMRDPMTNDWLNFSPISKPFDTVWVTSFDEFTDYIVKNGLPDAICFDHDLGTEDEKTGHDCAKWLVNFCNIHSKELPKWNIQSANPVGKDNINGVLNHYRRFVNHIKLNSVSEEEIEANRSKAVNYLFK